MPNGGIPAELSEIARALQALSDNLVEIAEDLKDRLSPGKDPSPPVDIVSALPWNQDPRWPFPKAPRALSKIRYVTIHHSGTTARSMTSIKAWNRYHTQSKGWSHLGYHFCVASLEVGGPMGLYQANELTRITWHDARNHDTVGVVIAGDLRAGKDGRPTAEQVDLFGQLMAWLVPQLPELTAVVGHSYWQRTACPGDLDRWGQDLADAAAHYGRDITQLMSVRATRLGGLLPTRLRVLQATSGPPMQDYEDV